MLPTVLICLSLAAAVGGAIYVIVRDRKRGRPSCGCGCSCSSCPMRCSAGKAAPGEPTSAARSAEDAT